MKIYLSARFARQAELRVYRSELTAMGHTVTSRWLDEETLNDDGISLPGCWTFPVPEIAENELDDLYAADCLVAFTEPPRVGPMRGGRHVEFGIALGMKIEGGRQCDGCGKRLRLIVVGYRENPFHCLDSVAFFPTWAEAKRYLASLA